MSFVDGQLHIVVGKGHTTMNYKGKNREVQNVLHVPRVKMNLLPIGMIADHGCIVIFPSKKCWIMKETMPPLIVAKGIRDHRSRFYKIVAPQERDLEVNMIKALDVQL